MKREHPAHRSAALCIAAALLLLVVPVETRADEVKLKDGRTIEGKVVGQYPEGVVLEVTLGGVATRLPIWQSQVESVTTKPLSAEAKRAARVSAQTTEPTIALKQDVRGTPYLEIPLTGRFGTDTVWHGVDAALRYARRHEVRDIVFVIDSMGGSMHEALTIVGLVERYKALGEPRFYFRAAVRRAEGAAAIIPMVMPTVYLGKQATIGGGADDAVDASGAYSNVPLATRMGDIADRYLLPRQVVEAMFDPQRALVAWHDQDDGVQLAEQLPAGVSPDQVIFVNVAGKRLTLSRTQAIALGLGRSVEVEPDATHEELISAVAEVEGIDDWRPFSEFGKLAMRQTAQRRQVQHQQQAVVQERRKASQSDDQTIPGDTPARAKLRQRMLRHWQQFSRVDPRAGQYSTYGVTVGSGSVVFGGAWREVDIEVFTRTSRREWTRRSLAAIAELRNLVEAYDAYVKRHGPYDPRWHRWQSALRYTPPNIEIDGQMIAPADLAAEARVLANELWHNRNRRGP